MERVSESVRREREKDRDGETRPQGINRGPTELVFHTVWVLQQARQQLHRAAPVERRRPAPPALGALLVLHRHRARGEVHAHAHLLTSHTEVLASPSQLLASPSQLLASPSELLAPHRHVLVARGGADEHHEGVRGVQARLRVLQLLAQRLHDQALIELKGV
jgi:hypothetical protein